jgi:histidinol dehydrogenase
MSINISTIDLTTASRATISDSTRRSAVPDRSLRERAAAIVSDVELRGDSALIEYTERFGGGLDNGQVVVDPAVIDAALDDLDARSAEALDSAIRSVRICHEAQLPTPTETTPTAGVLVERMWSPIDRIGVYVPGGRAAYPSTVIMGVVPALVAGVADICIATPARADGSIDPTVLATAAKLGIREVYAMGGAQAIGALAYGTETVKQVTKIVGPGGPWVTAGKLAVYGDCGIDLPAGPSEAAIVADRRADPRFVAADVMCQAEHGDESAVVLVTTDRRIVAAVLEEIERQLPLLERADIITKALENEGTIVLAPDTATALAYVNDWAPEHLTLHTANARSDAATVPNAGSVFIGAWTPEAAGDYATGANHILPTGGLAGSYGPLSVEDFGSWRQIQTLTRVGLETLAPTITSLATTEGLTAHANSVTVRLGGAE